MKTDQIQWDCPNITPNERAKMVIEARGLSYADIARHVGISDVAVRKWVLHSKTFEWGRVKKYAEAIGVPPMWLLTGYQIFTTTEGEEVAKLLGDRSIETLRLIKASMSEGSKNEN